MTRDERLDGLGPLAKRAGRAANEEQPACRPCPRSHGGYHRRVRICALGWRADAALRTGANARVLAALTAATYLDVGGDIVWLCAHDATPHGRAIHVVPSASGWPSGVEVGDVLPLPRSCALRPWRPDDPAMPAAAAMALRHGATRLATRAAALGTPRGFGAWLLGAPLRSPLDIARSRVDAFAKACAADDAAGAAHAATALVGLGPGLTPSGDDFVGGAFFARAHLGRAGAADAGAWGAAASSVKLAAARLTHRIGAALLGDLLVGEAWAPLHELAAALGQEDDAGALDAAGRLTRLGHSSGWDLLAGFVAGART